VSSREAIANADNVGNLSAGKLRHLIGSEERSLVIVTSHLIACVAAFNLVPLPMFGALVCLALWGAALGAGAPLATTVLAERSGHDKGVVLATAETLNDIAILSVIPIASMMLARETIATATAVFAAGLGIGAALTLYDALAGPSRIQRI
jgi:predicted MFS family arabinose efflux permease